MVSRNMSPPPIDIWIQMAGEILDKVEYRDWKFFPNRGWTGVALVSVTGEFQDTYDPAKTFKATRSATVMDDTTNGLLNAAMVAALTLETHEAFERFKFNDERPFDPHRFINVATFNIPEWIDKEK